MLTDIIVVDEIFSNPEHLEYQARKFSYYNCESHPFPIKTGNKMFYSGHRTESLHILDENLYVSYNTEILNKIADNSFGLYRSDATFNYAGQMFFHYMTKDDVFDDTWLHKDPALYAGVIYLQKNPSPNSGTILIKGDEEKIVENKYNRLLLYRSDLMHSSQSAFGNSIEDGRLTLTFTYNILAFDIKYNNEKFKKNERRSI